MRLRSVFVLVVAAFLPFLPARAEDQVIVTFHDEPVAARPSDPRSSETLARFREDLAAITGLTATNTASVKREFVVAVHGAAVRVASREALLAIARLPYVAAVYPDRDVEAYGAAAAPTTAPLSIKSSFGGAGIVVAIIDSGIDYNHPALGGGIGAGFKVRSGYDFVNDDDDPMDDHRHGTHVAGIVAANSATVSGVAPNATLLAFKVLNDQGKGKQSDVIAAIERSLDPNSDGDLSDRADVINISLGAPGNPDDPVSQAVENASQAGAVVCAAVGNDGVFHGISSPAVAISAIAVGAIDGEGAIAEFSNGGPGALHGSIKPDVVAPGVSIRSTVPGGGTALLSGTSMASPYVAGLVALLREAHPDWSPDHIRSAVINAATPLEGIEVMSQGAGRADRERAELARAWMSPTHLNFGLHSSEQAVWTKTRTISVTNSGSSTVTYRARVTNPFAAVELTVAPAEIVLAPGETRSIGATLKVANGTLGEILSPSFSFGGAVYLESDLESLVVPWSFIKAARATVTFDLEFPQILWAASEPRRGSFSLTGPYSAETLLEPGRYDLAIVAAANGEVRLVIDENVQIDGDVKIDKRSSDAGHTITLAARDAEGQPFPYVSSDSVHYFPHARLLLPSPTGDASVELPKMATKTMHTSSFSDRFGLLFTESFIDATRQRAFIAQHEPLRGVAQSQTLDKSPADYSSQQITFRFPADSSIRELGILARGMVRRPVEVGRSPEGVLQQVSGGEWHGVVYMTPEVHPDFASGIQFFSYTGHEFMQGLASTISPMLRRTSEGFVSALQFSPPPLPIGTRPGERFVYPSGAIYPLHILSTNGSGISGTFEWQGQRNERRNLERARSTLRVTDATNREVLAVPLAFGQIYAPLPGEGAYRASISTERFELAGVAGRAEVSVGFDTRREDSTPPTLTSLAVLDVGEKHGMVLPLRGNGALVFSVADYGETPDGPAYRSLPAHRARLFFRRSGFLTWTELHLDHVGEDSDAAGRLPVGQIFRANLSDALLREGGVELRFEISDTAGNDVVFELGPAIFASSAGTRQRPASR